MRGVFHGVFQVLTAIAVVGLCATAAAERQAHERNEYRVVQTRLQAGWNTWDSRSVLTHVLLPEGFALQLGFKEIYWLGDHSLRRALVGRSGKNVEVIRPGLHALDGSYSQLEIRWRGLQAKVEAAREGTDLVVVVTPQAKAELPLFLVIETALPWNRPGTLAREGRTLVAKLPRRTVRVHTTAPPIEDPYADAVTPYLLLPLTEPVGLSTGRARSLDEMRRVVARERGKLEGQAAKYGELAETYLAVMAGLAWNTIYEPKLDRVVSTVGRLWNEEYGGYCLFGWDNFFLAYMTALYSRDLAYANVIEHLRSATDEGQIPNDDRGNGAKSWDRSQPPVGAIMVREIYRRYPERWLLEASFEPLLAWNRWWMARRKNGELLSYGTHPTKNPYKEPAVHTRKGAGYESGMDDSPMYEGVPFNAEKNTLELQDVGLNSLYLADCAALAEMAALLGRKAEQEELEQRAAAFTRAMAELWDERAGSYLNRRSDTGELSRTLSPTMFYPLLARLPEPARAQRMIDEHLNNPDEFFGAFMLPSIARNHPEFARQRYWRGAVWPPLNFLVYLGLRNYGFEEARADLSKKSRAMFMSEWRRKGYVSENYSAITGTGDDERLSSDPLHSWGALLGFLSFIESGVMAAPEQPLATRRER